MNDVVQAAALASIGPTLVGAAALIQATLGKRQAAAVNRAVNHVEPGEASLYEHAATTSQRLAEFIDYQHVRNHDLSNRAAMAVGRARIVEQKVDQYMTDDAAAHVQIGDQIDRLIERLEREDP